MSASSFTIVVNGLTIVVPIEHDKPLYLSIEQIIELRMYYSKLNNVTYGVSTLHKYSDFVFEILSSDSKDYYVKPLLSSVNPELVKDIKSNAFTVHGTKVNLNEPENLF